MGCTFSIWWPPLDPAEVALAVYKNASLMAPRRNVLILSISDSEENPRPTEVIISHSWFGNVWPSYRKRWKMWPGMEKYGQVCCHYDPSCHRRESVPSFPVGEHGHFCFFGSHSRISEAFWWNSWSWNILINPLLWSLMTCHLLNTGQPAGFEVWHAYETLVLAS